MHVVVVTAVSKRGMGISDATVSIEHWSSSSTSSLSSRSGSSALAAASSLNSTAQPSSMSSRT